MNSRRTFVGLVRPTKRLPKAGFKPPLACRLLRRVGAAIGPEARDAPGFSREASPSRHEARAARDQRRATAQERGEAAEAGGTVARPAQETTLGQLPGNQQPPAKAQALIL